MHKLLFYLSFLILIAVQTSSLATYTALDELRTGMKGSRPVWSLKAYDRLPQVWGLPQIKPGTLEFKEEIKKRYGLYYDENFTNNGLPVGVVQTAKDYAWGEKGITMACIGCHTSKPLGKVTYSVGNVFFDYQRFYNDLDTAAGKTQRPFFEINMDRNSIVSFSNYAGRLAIFSRNHFPALNLFRYYAVFADPNSQNNIVEPLQKELPYREPVKTQPWANFRFKKPYGYLVDASYHASPAGVHYMLHFTLDPSGIDFVHAVDRFDKVVPDYLMTLEAPQYPYPLNQTKADKGEAIYQKNCAACHGTFERQGTKYQLKTYPGKLIPREIVKTDTLRIDYKIRYDEEVPPSLLKLVNRTYQYIAPPLVGIWARAPYLHNGSIANLRQLLDSKLRIARFALRSYAEDAKNYDTQNIGWKFTDLTNFSPKDIQQLKLEDPSVRVYDPNRLGMSNEGHTFGDKLSEEERDQLIEFLKGV